MQRMTDTEIRRQTVLAVVFAEGDRCPLCDERRVNSLHEIVSRKRVQGSQKAKRALFKSVELCAAVCDICHPSGNDAENHKLMALKVKQYGQDRVLVAIDRVNEHLKCPVNPAEYGIGLVKGESNVQPQKILDD